MFVGTARLEVLGPMGPKVPWEPVKVSLGDLWSQFCFLRGHKRGYCEKVWVVSPAYALLLAVPRPASLVFLWVVQSHTFWPCRETGMLGSSTRTSASIRWIILCPALRVQG